MNHEALVHEADMLRRALGQAQSETDVAMDRLWEVKEAAHSEMLCLRKELAAAHQRIFDLEISVGMPRRPRLSVA